MEMGLQRTRIVLRRAEIFGNKLRFKRSVKQERAPLETRAALSGWVWKLNFDLASDQGHVFVPDFSEARLIGDGLRSQHRLARRVIVHGNVRRMCAAQTSGRPAALHRFIAPPCRA